MDEPREEVPETAAHAEPGAGAGDSPPGVMGALATLVVGLVIYFGASLAAFVVTAFVGTAVLAARKAQGVSVTFWEWLSHPLAMVLLLGLVAVFASLFTFAAAGGERRDFRGRLGLRRARLAPREWPLVVVGGIAALGLGILVLGGLRQAGLQLPPDSSRAGMLEALLGAPVALRVAFVFAGSVLTGISEELVFRGYIQRGLTPTWRPWVAIPVASVVFALMHGSWGYDIYVLPVAVWLGYVAWRSDSILPTMVCHVCVNGLGQTAAAFLMTGTAARANAYRDWAHRPHLLGGALLAVIFAGVLAALVWRFETRGFRDADGEPGRRTV